MRNSEFWVMFKKSNVEAPSFGVPGHFAIKRPSVFIVELTSDEMVYIWPIEPLYDSLCLVCTHQNKRCSEVCKPVTVSGFPCLFEPVPETQLSQDFDEFLYDGDYLEVFGYFYSFQDFKRQSGCSDESYFSLHLGSLSSIREARQVFNAVIQAGKVSK